MTGRKKYDFTGKRIWVIEDDEFLRNWTRDRLQQDGAIVETFENPLNAVELLDRVSNDPHTPPQLIITDYTYSPTFSGDPMFAREKHNIENAAELLIDAVKTNRHRKINTIPIIVITGRSAVKYQKYPGVDVTVIEKGAPNEIQETLDTIEQKLSSSRKK